jgi:hypothetical protein
VSYLEYPNSFKNANEFGQFLEENPQFELTDFAWINTTLVPLNRPLVYYISAICGGGKSHVFREAAIKRAKKGKHSVIAVKTMDQADEVAKSFDGAGVRCKRVNGETHPKNATRTIRFELGEKENGGDNGWILIVTHAAICCLLDDFPGKENTAVFFDEIPEMYRILTRNLPKSHHAITQYVKVEDYSENFGKGESLDLDALKEIGKNEDNDEFWALLQQMGWGLWSQSWDWYVDLKDWHDLHDGKRGQLAFHFLLRPEVFEGWERFSIASADWDDSPFSKFFKDKLEFVEDPLSKGLRATEHVNSQRLTLEWAFVGNASQNSLRKSSGLGDDSTNLEAARRQTAIDWAGEIFIHHAHKCEDDFFDPDLAERLPADSKGYNKYDHYTKVAVFSAPNPSPASYAFIKEVMGLDTDEYRMWVQESHLYQIICRTPMRNPKSMKQVTARVLTQDLAIAVGAKFGAKCLIQQFRIEGMDSDSSLNQKTRRPKIYESLAEKQKAYRQRLKQRSQPVPGEPTQSQTVTKLPLKESNRNFVTESGPIEPRDQAALRQDTQDPIGPLEPIRPFEKESSINESDNESIKEFLGLLAGKLFTKESESISKESSGSFSSKDSSLGKQLVPEHLARQPWGAIEFLQYAKRLHSAGKPLSEIEATLTKVAGGSGDRLMQMECILKSFEGTR